MISIIFLYQQISNTYHKIEWFFNDREADLNLKVFEELWEPCFMNKYARLNDITFLDACADYHHSQVIRAFLECLAHLVPRHTCIFNCHQNGIQKDWN